MAFATGSLFVGLTVGLMLFKMVLWVAVVRPAVAMPFNMLYVAATALMLWSYVRAMIVKPRGLRSADAKVANSETDAPEGEVTRYCERCDHPKPAFVHHCSVCQRCIYRMVWALSLSLSLTMRPRVYDQQETNWLGYEQDHHCPWTNNCVGWDNKKFFLLFLLYTSLSCLTFAAMATPLIVEADARPSVVLKIGWILAVAIGALLAGYLTFHLWLLREGRTTLEFLSGSPGELADYSLGYNLRVYFGNDKWTWALPTTPKEFRAGYRSVLAARSEETQKLVV